MVVSKALAYRCAFINKCSLFGSQNQVLGTVLKNAALSASAEYILIMPDFNHLCQWKFVQYCPGVGVIPNRFFHINM